MIKTLNKLILQENFLSLINCISPKPAVNIQPHGERLSASPQDQKQGEHVSSTAQHTTVCSVLEAAGSAEEGRAGWEASALSICVPPNPYFESLPTVAASGERKSLRVNEVIRVGLLQEGSRPYEKRHHTAGSPSCPCSQRRGPTGTR